MPGIESGGPNLKEVAQPDRNEALKTDQSYLRMTSGHLKSLHRDLTIRREFSDLGITFPSPKSDIYELHIPISAINEVGEKLYGRSLRTLKSNIALEISSNLHHALLHTYGLLVESIHNFNTITEPRKTRYIEMMRDANDSLRQLRASNNLSDELLPQGYRRYTKEQFDDISQQLSQLNRAAHEKGFPVDIIGESDTQEK